MLIPGDDDKYMSHTEKIEDLKALEQVLQMMRVEMQQVRGEAKQAKEYAPDAVDNANEKLDSAQAYWDESYERLEEANERLEDFLVKSKIARDTYDLASEDPSASHEREAARARERADRAFVKLDNSINKTRSKIAKTDSYINKAQSRVKIALIKAAAEEEKIEHKKVRINFTLPEYMKDDWKGMADNLSTSVSQMIREAMSLYTSELKGAEGDFERGMTKFGAKMEQVGKRVEDYVEKNVSKRYNPETGKLRSVRFGGHEVMADKIPFNRRQPESPFQSSAASQSSEKKDRIKKRITGLIKIQKSLPIDKLAQSLEISAEQAENIIYELAAEGIEGNLKNGTFKYTGEDEDIIKALHEIIDRMA
jgi:hypothetical protein